VEHVAGRGSASVRGVGGGTLALVAMMGPPRGRLGCRSGGGCRSGRFPPLP